MGIIDELKQQRKPDCTSEKKLIEKLYEECLKIIKFKNKFGTTNIVYEVPSITVGFPIYNHGEISYKLTTKLKKMGFKTTFKHPDKIYIKW